MASQLENLELPLSLVTFCRVPPCSPSFWPFFAKKRPTFLAFLSLDLESLFLLLGICGISDLLCVVFFVGFFRVELSFFLSFLLDVLEPPGVVEDSSFLKTPTIRLASALQQVL